MWQRHLDRDDSKIVDLFSGQLRSSLHCSVCSHYSNTFDVFCDLSLPIPKKSDYGRTMCERCNRRTETTKRLTIQRFPRILVMHLNRFTMSRYSISKSTVPVSFPLNGLDLGPFGPVGCPVLYDLYAVCSHSGTVNMGHYTAACREEEGWCYYNDSWWVQLFEKLQSNQAYVLFYELKSFNITRK
uniref:ubiquitinyl hydrolase 1 n=1 Tax=Sinocyclocheilus anshuiensis TaxID=1608454 RepID=A0A671RF00_9TELE